MYKDNRWAIHVLNDDLLESRTKIGKKGKLVWLRNGRNPACTKLIFITTEERTKKGKGRGALILPVCSKKYLFVGYRVEGMLERCKIRRFIEIHQILISDGMYTLEEDKNQSKRKSVIYELIFN